MDIQGVPKIGISSVLHSKYMIPGSINVIDDDIAIFDTASIISLFDGPSKLEIAGVGLCLEGRSCINISLHDYEMVPGRMMVALPDQIIENKEASDDFKAIFIAVSKKLLEVLPRMGDILSLFLFLKDRPYLDITQMEQEVFEEYHSLIWKKIKNESNIYRRDSVLGLMHSFFYELCNIFRMHAPSIPPAIAQHKSRKEFIFEHFYQMLSKSYQSERSVKFYAEQLCLTPKHLSGVIKEVSGKTVGEWIDEFVILEAKALLNSSSMNIQEISDRLNFANQSFFGKYFKHYTGMSPKGYRKNR